MDQPIIANGEWPTMLLNKGDWFAICWYINIITSADEYLHQADKDIHQLQFFLFLKYLLQSEKIASRLHLKDFSWS